MHVNVCIDTPTYDYNDVGEKDGGREGGRERQRE